MPEAVVWEILCVHRMTWLALFLSVLWALGSERVVKGLQVCASVAAAASEQQQLPNGALMNGSASHNAELSTGTVLRALKVLLDLTSDTEVPATVEEAALDAVGRLGASSAAASLFFTDEQQLAHDVATLALGRAGVRLCVAWQLVHQFGLHNEALWQDSCHAWDSSLALMLSATHIIRCACTCAVLLWMPPMASRKSLWTIADAVQWMTGSSERRIAALHALASVAAVPADGGLSHLSANAEECFREAAFSATTSPATALLGFARQPFPEMRIASFRYSTGLNIIRQKSFMKACYGIARASFMLRLSSHHAA